MLSVFLSSSVTWQRLGYGQFSESKLPKFNLRVSHPKTIPYVHSKSYFESSNLPGAWNIFQIELLKTGRIAVGVCKVQAMQRRTQKRRGGARGR